MTSYLWVRNSHGNKTLASSFLAATTEQPWSEVLITHIHKPESGRNLFLTWFRAIGPLRQPLAWTQNQIHSNTKLFLACILNFPFVLPGHSLALGKYIPQDTLKNMNFDKLSAFSISMQIRLCGAPTPRASSANGSLYCSHLSSDNCFPSNTHPIWAALSQIAIRKTII